MINNLLVADQIARIKHFAVAIKKFPHHTHGGVIYLSPTAGKHFLLHFGEPGHLKQEDWNADWGWAGLSVLKREELSQLAVLCEHVFDAKESLPYGFRFTTATKFLLDGRLQTGDGCKGITCATFALGLLACFDIMLLDLATWPVRPEDAGIVNCIASHQGDPEVAAEFPCSRFRPEEVIAGCMANALNVPFDVAEPLGRQVVGKMEEYLDRKRSGI